MPHLPGPLVCKPQDGAAGDRGPWSTPIPPARRAEGPVARRATQIGPEQSAPPPWGYLMERAQRATGGCQGWGVQGGGARRGERRPRLAARGPGLRQIRDACPERRASAFTETRAHTGGPAAFCSRAARRVRRSEHELALGVRATARASGDARAGTRTIGGGATVKAGRLGGARRAGSRQNRSSRPLTRRDFWPYTPCTPASPWSIT